VRRHAKAPTAGSTPGTSTARLTVVAVFLCALLAFLGSSAPALAAPKGITGYFGNPSSATSTAPGEFNNPQGVAVNNGTGEIYVADRGNNRIQRFGADGDFISTWGADVISGAAAGTGTWASGATSLTAVKATTGRFLAGQLISGEGIQPGTRIASVPALLGASYTLTVSKPTVAGATNAPLTVVAGPSNVPVNERQVLTIPSSVSSGTFKLNAPAYQGYAAVATAAAFSKEPTASEVQTGLESLAQIGSGNVEVTSSAVGVYEIVFKGARADTNMPQLTIANSTLVGGVATVGTAAQGTAPEICVVASECKAGVSWGTGATEVNSGGIAASPLGISINQVTGDLYVSQEGFRRIEQFTASGAFVRAWGANAVRSGPEQADEQQRLTIDATGGQYKLTTTTGIGSVTTANGSNEVTVTVASLGSFRVGDNVTLTGSTIVAGTTITNVVGNVVTLSNPVTAGAGAGKTLNATETTADIAFGAAANGGAGSVETALTDLPGIGVGDVTVTGGPGGAGGTAPYLLSFGGAFANANLPAITIAAGSSPIVGTATIATLNDGAVGFEICETAANCKIGEGGEALGFNNEIGYPEVVPAGAPSAGNVIIGDNTTRAIEFTSAGVFVRAWGWNTVVSGASDTVSGAFEVCRAILLDLCGGNPEAGSPSAGAGLGQFGPIFLLSPGRFAIGTDNSIYTVEAKGNFRVQRFAQSGESLTPSLFNPAIGTGETLTSSSPAASSANTPTDVEIDPVSGHIWVVRAMEAGKGNPSASGAERRIFEFDSSGSLVETHIAGFNLNSVNGFALKPGGAVGYLTTSTPKMGVNVLGDPVPPEVTIAATTGISASGATLHGSVDPNGGGPIHTLYRFEYRPAGTTSWIKTPAVDADAGNGEDPVPVSQAIPSGLEANKNYEVRLVATKGGSPVTSTGNAGDFKTTAIPPSAKTVAAFWDASSDELVLRGTINPSNSAATYYFEYGTASCSSSACESVPAGQDASVGSGGVMVEKSQRIAGLSPETIYHFRIVADNGIESSPGVTRVFGDELTFTTPPAKPCDNEQFRTGASSNLAECRAYEWVSDGDGWGVGVNTLNPTIADDGDRAQFVAQAFGQPDGIAGPNTPYIAVRGEEGWSVRSVAAPPELSFANGFGVGGLLSADLGTFLLGEGTRGQRLRGEVQWGLAGLDGSRRQAAPLIVPLSHAGSNLDKAQTYTPLGSSSDLSTFVFYRFGALDQTGYKLLPDEPLLSGRSNLYSVTGAGGPSPTLDIVNRANGKAGAVLGGVCGAGLGGRSGIASGDAVASDSVSNDGSAIYFTIRPGSPTEGTCGQPINEPGVAGPKRLFKREDGETTVAVTAPQCSPACAGPDGDDEYKGASEDGSVVFFTTPRRLLNADTDNTSDLYLYDSQPPSGEPTLALASGGSGAKALNVFSYSADGSRVYFTAEGSLAGPDARGVSPSIGAPNLYLYQRDEGHPTGRIVFVATLAGSDYGASSFYALPRSGPESGRYLVFSSSSSLLDEDIDSSMDLYRYDDQSGDLTCPSCVGNGNFDLNPENAGIGSEEVRLSSSPSADQLRPQASGDGSTIVFVTRESLLPDADLNGAADVYVWREGALGLISDPQGLSRTGSAPSLASISADGKSVFFFTDSALVGGDTNNVPDLYVARVGGGFAEPAPPDDCASEESCHGVPGTPPPGSSAVSESFSGAGNSSAREACAKGKVRRKGRCVRKHSHHSRKHSSKKSKKKSSKRGAGHDRGGKR
jgi:hypothetical protein